MKTQRLIIAVSFILGFLVTLFDAIVDSIFFYEGTLIELLITDIPPHEFYIRIILFSFCVLFGSLLSIVVEKHSQYVEESEKKFRFLYENLPLPYQSLDSQCRIQEVNATWLKKMGYEREKIIGKSFREILPEEEKETFRSHFEEVWKEGQAFGRKIRLKTSDGTEIEAQFDCSLSQEESDNSTMSHCVFRDVTQTQIMQRQLRETELRANFLRDLMFHDLSNIHQGILLSLELLTRMELSPKAVELVLKTVGQTERASNLLSNVRKFIRVDTEELHFEEIDILSVLRDSIESAEARFPTKDVNLRLMVHPGSYTVNADISLIDAFYNIFHNTIKLDEKIPVRIDVSVERKGELIVVEIRHFGPGIPDERKDILFKRFEQTKSMGIGLGLTLAKRVFDRHNATIEVKDRIENDPSQGAKFIIRIPAME